MRLIFTLAFLATIRISVNAKHWAVVVAGSNTWSNYRHQADACHAYQILHKHGIPDENIIVMMYNDIANNSQNPTPGKIINKPNGPDVFKGVPLDYTEEAVNPENFLNVLQGKKVGVTKTSSGKVVDSGPDDNIFVFFADHGAPGLVAFPDDVLHAPDLIAAIKSMYENKRYKKMVFYIEACESGSMFNRHKLPSNINVFATTAANGVESSYACYFDKQRETYLGDVYSVKWMENSDKAHFLKETLKQQFSIVRNETSTSHVEEFGDLTISSMTLTEFQGDGKEAYDNTTKLAAPVPITDAVPSPDVPLEILYHRLRNADSESERNEILRLINEERKIRDVIKQTVDQIVSELVHSHHKQQHILNKPAKPTEHKCYKTAVSQFQKVCFNFNKYEHALRHIYVLSNLCDAGFHVDDITGATKRTCSSMHDAYAL